MVVIARGTLNNVSFAPTAPWRFLLLPVDIVAIVLGIRSVGIATTYLDGQRRREQAAADYDLKYRWQQD